MGKQTLMTRKEKKKRKKGLKLVIKIKPIDCRLVCTR